MTRKVIEIQDISVDAVRDGRASMERSGKKVHRNEMGRSKCPLCGAPDVGGLSGCLSLFAELGGKEFADQAYFEAHRLPVDAYSLQHPERFMVSSKSAATHLAAMCWTMERGPSRHLPKALKAYVDGPRRFATVDPPSPGHRGSVTIADVSLATSAEDHKARAWEWARSAWEAWRQHRDQARQWVAEAAREAP